MVETVQIAENQCPLCFHYFISNRAVASHKPYCEKNPFSIRKASTRSGSGHATGWEHVSGSIAELNNLKEERHEIVRQLNDVDERIRKKEEEITENAKRVIYGRKDG